VVVSGRLNAVPRPLPDWLRSRHISGRLTVTAVESARHGSWSSQLANGIRSRLLRSGLALPRNQRGLFAGFLLGDDREQPPELIDDFRASGLSHLLVVSGQNVAFTLAVFEPALRRLGRRKRLVATIAVLAMFTTVTRFEPSVLRAVFMAGVVAITRCLGRPQKGLRVLSIAVIALLVIDPLLSYSVGFALSLAATAGLAVWSGPLGDRLPVSARLRSVLGPTLAAQGGASLVMIPVFGSIPAVSILANVVVVPFAAPLMGWGVAAGLPAGILGYWPSRIVHLPTSIVLRMVAWSARTSGRVPLGSISAPPAVAFGLITWWACRSSHRHRDGAWAGALVAVLLWPSTRAVFETAPAESGRSVERGAVLWTSNPPQRAAGGVVGTAQVLVLSHEVDVGRLLTALRRHRIGAVDVVVVVNGGRSQGSVIAALRSRVSLGAVLVGDRASSDGGVGVVRVTRSVRATLGDLKLSVSPSSPSIAPSAAGRLSVRVVRAPPSALRP
jgi:ComEC/Rec2-related protein